MLFLIMPKVSLFGGMTVASGLEPVKKEEVPYGGCKGSARFEARIQG